MYLYASYIEYVVISQKRVEFEISSEGGAGVVGNDDRRYSMNTRYR